MFKIQSRIGLFFAIISWVLYLTKLLYVINGDLSLIDFVFGYRIIFIVIGFMFLLSSLFDWFMWRLGQIFLVSCLAIFSLCANYTMPIWGMFLLIIAIILCYVYSLYSKRKAIRLSMTALSIYIAFVFLPLRDVDDKYIRGFEWTFFIAAFVFIIWFIFKDSMEELESKDKAELDKCINVADEAISVARDAVNKLEKR
jgi:hypothetical protein